MFEGSNTQSERLLPIIYGELVILIALLIVIGVLKIWCLLRKIVAAAVIDVKTDKTTYLGGENCLISGSLTFVDEPQPDKVVAFAIEPPEGDVFSLPEVKTNEYGLYETAWEIPGDAAEGAYRLTAASMGATATASFQLLEIVIETPKDLKA